MAFEWFIIGDIQFRGEKGGRHFRDQFPHRVGLLRMIPADPQFGPMAQLMQDRGIETAVDETGLVRHLNVIAVAVIGPTAFGCRRAIECRSPPKRFPPLFFRIKFSVGSKSGWTVSGRPHGLELLGIGPIHLIRVEHDELF